MVREREEAREDLAQRLGLRRGAPESEEGKESLEIAESEVKRLLDYETKQRFRYDPKWLLESERWWYLPCIAIGQMGYIVEKRDGVGGEWGQSQLLTREPDWARVVSIILRFICLRRRFSRFSFRCG